MILPEYKLLSLGKEVETLRKLGKDGMDGVCLVKLGFTLRVAWTAVEFCLDHRPAQGSAQHHVAECPVAATIDAAVGIDVELRSMRALDSVSLRILKWVENQDVTFHLWTGGLVLFS